MEKRTPHCELSRVKALIEAGKVRPTHTARTTAALLGFDFKGMIAVVASLTMNDFYKSMTLNSLLRCARSWPSTSAKQPRSSAAASMRSHGMRTGKPSPHWR